VLLSGCATTRAVEPEPKTGTTTAAICTDDTTGCKDPNGTGVYTAEGGSAGIGDQKLMITHFVNDSGRVTFHGRYFDAGQKQWAPLPTPGLAYGAVYQGKPLSVVAVSETSTAMQWQLFDPEAQVVVLAPEPGKPPTGLTVYLQVALPHAASSTAGNTPNTAAPAPLRDAAGVPLPAPAPMAAPLGDIRYYALDFTPGGSGTTERKQPLTTYQLSWHDTRSVAPVPYCADAQGGADTVVFQQGIDVDPVNGRVAAIAYTAGLVTLSCSLGAPAKVYGWGYRYDAKALFYFAAAIQMKRASYCGDEGHYTVAGTEIHIFDDQGFHPIGGLKLVDKIATVEASWTPDGATCVTPGNRRHVDMPFAGCPNRILPSCDAKLLAAKPPYLVDAPLAPGAN
jgi:hypothetical protein